jgi:hypothetical protein
MLGLVLVLLLIAVLFGVGWAVAHALLWIAAILLVIWLLGFAFRSGERARWYRW